MGPVMLDVKKHVINSDSESVHLSYIASLETARDDILSQKHLFLDVGLNNSIADPKHGSIISWTGTVAKKHPVCFTHQNSTSSRFDLLSHVLKLADSLRILFIISLFLFFNTLLLPIFLALSSTPTATTSMAATPTSSPSPTATSSLAVGTRICRPEGIGSSITLLLKDGT